MQRISWSSLHHNSTQDLYKIHCSLYRPQTRGTHIPETHEQTTSPLWQVSTLNIRSITDCHIGHTRFANSLYCICTVRLQITNESNRQSCTTASNSMLRIENPECSEPNNLDHIQNDKFAVFRLLMPGSHNLPKSHPHGYTMADLSVSKPRNRQLFWQSVSPFPSPKKSVQDWRRSTLWHIWHEQHCHMHENLCVALASHLNIIDCAPW